jgi:hypothetical protein
MASLNQNTRTENKKPGNPAIINKRPDVRDNLNSRMNEEQDFKGDDTTHNNKGTEKEKLKRK